MPTKSERKTKFLTGRLGITPGAVALINHADVVNGLARHLDGDWGNVGSEDWESNEEALKLGLRLISSYSDRDANQFWIITEADRHATTILLPSEY